MKEVHEDKIRNLEDSLDKVWDKLRVMVVASCTATQSSTNGLKWPNNQAQVMHGLSKSHFDSPLVCVKVEKRNMCLNIKISIRVLFLALLLEPKATTKIRTSNIIHNVLNINVDVIHEIEKLLICCRCWVCWPPFCSFLVRWLLVVVWLLFYLCVLEEFLIKDFKDLIKHVFS